MEELVVGDGERDGSERHVEDFAVQFQIARLLQQLWTEAVEQAVGVVSDAGQRPSELGQAGLGVGVGQRDAADVGDREVRGDFATEEQELRVQPAFGVDGVQQNLADGPLGVAEARGELVVAAAVEQAGHVGGDFGQRGGDVDRWVYVIGDVVTSAAFGGWGLWAKCDPDRAAGQPV